MSDTPLMHTHLQCAFNALRGGRKPVNLEEMGKVYETPPRNLSMGSNQGPWRCAIFNYTKKGLKKGCDLVLVFLGWFTVINHFF